MCSTIFPLEIIETFIDFLAEDDEDHLTLKTCSLVCQALLPICSKHIFNSIVLNRVTVDHLPSGPTTLALERLLSRRPEISSYIRQLDYCIQATDLDSPAIQEALRQISRLESLTIWHSRSTDRPLFDWSNNPMRSTLLHLLHLPTITYFRASWITNFILSDLTPCINLKVLHFGFHMRAAISTQNTFPAAFPDQLVQLNELSLGHHNHDIFMNLCKSRRPDGKPIIDFSSLTKVTAKIHTLDDQEVAKELFKQCNRLAYVNMIFLMPYIVRPIFADILRPSIQSLKSIVVGIHIDAGDWDLLLDIPSELDGMRNNNFIESITIQVQVFVDSNYVWDDGNAWGILDEVLTRSGWDALRRVSLEIIIASHDEIDTDELEAILRKFRERQFPRLSTSATVSLNFDIESHIL